MQRNCEILHTYLSVSDADQLCMFCSELWALTALTESEYISPSSPENGMYLYTYVYIRINMYVYKFIYIRIYMLYMYT